MTKKDIVRTISEEVGLTQQQTKKIVQKTFDAIIDSLVNERRIELRNFGVFEVKQRAARKARNPRTGHQVDVPEKYVVTFKPGKEMEARVKELSDAANAARLARQEAAERLRRLAARDNVSADDTADSRGPAAPSNSSPPADSPPPSDPAERNPYASGADLGSSESA